MSEPSTLSKAEVELLDQFYRMAGLRSMASPHVHYDDRSCPHAGCRQKMEWVDFKLELHGEPEAIYKPLVHSWWGRAGFVGRCPSCGGWIHFKTLGMTVPDDQEVRTVSQLPLNWAEIAQFA